MAAKLSLKPALNGMPLAAVAIGWAVTITLSLAIIIASGLLHDILNQHPQMFFTEVSS